LSIFPADRKMPMAKLRAISGGKGKGKPLTLVYGLRLYNVGEVARIDEGHVTLGDGSESHVTLHLIEGTRDQIRAQLLASIDAFFDIYNNDPPHVRRSPSLRSRKGGEGSEPGC
jgi:hypothetical protein